MNITYTEICTKSTDELIQIIRDCEDRLGLVSAKQYSEMVNRNVRTIQQQISDGKFKTVDFVDRTYIVINDHLKSK